MYCTVYEWDDVTILWVRVQLSTEKSGHSRVLYTFLQHLLNLGAGCYAFDRFRPEADLVPILALDSCILTNCFLPDSENSSTHVLPLLCTKSCFLVDSPSAVGKGRELSEH